MMVGYERDAYFKECATRELSRYLGFFSQHFVDFDDKPEGSESIELEFKVIPDDLPEDTTEEQYIERCASEYVRFYEISVFNFIADSAPEVPGRAAWKKYKHAILSTSHMDAAKDMVKMRSKNSLVLAYPLVPEGYVVFGDIQKFMKASTICVPEAEFTSDTGTAKVRWAFKLVAGDTSCIWKEPVKSDALCSV